MRQNTRATVMIPISMIQNPFQVNKGWTHNHNYRKYKKSGSDLIHMFRNGLVFSLSQKYRDAFYDLNICQCGLYTETSHLLILN